MSRALTIVTLPSTPAFDGELTHKHKTFAADGILTCDVRSVGVRAVDIGGVANARGPAQGTLVWSGFRFS
jgi:hypothetical protein